MTNWWEEYARQVRNGLHVDIKHDKTVHCALGLTGESGEVADLIKKSQYAGGRPLDEDKLREELGDTLWYLTALADQHGWNLQQLAGGNIAKLEARHHGRGFGYDLSEFIKAVKIEGRMEAESRQADSVLI